MKVQSGGVRACAATCSSPARAIKVSMLGVMPGNISPASTESNRADFSNMKRNEMKKCAQHLWEEGKIDLTQLGMLQMAGPLGKAGPNGGFIPFTETERTQLDNIPTDYPKLIRGAIAFIENRHEESNPKSGYVNWKQILSVLEGPQTALPKVDANA